MWLSYSWRNATHCHAARCSLTKPTRSLQWRIHRLTQTSDHFVEFGTLEHVKLLTSSGIQRSWNARFKHFTIDWLFNTENKKERGRERRREKAHRELKNAVNWLESRQRIAEKPLRPRCFEEVQEHSLGPLASIVSHPMGSDALVAALDGLLPWRVTFQILLYGSVVGEHKLALVSPKQVTNLK